MCQYLSRLSFLIFISTLLGGSLFGQKRWHQQNSGTSSTLTSVDFFDAKNGLVVGADGTLLSTNNGGRTWLKIDLGLTNSLTCVDFVDKDVAFVCGANGLILKTTNGGLNWTKQNSGVTAKLNSIHFVDKNIGYAVGKKWVFVKTTDGGLNWVSQFLPLDYGVSIWGDLGPDPNSIDRLMRVQFLNKDTGLVVSQARCMYRTIDGGISWKLNHIGYVGHLNTPRGYGPSLNFFHFIDSNLVVACSAASGINPSINFGKTWIRGNNYNPDIGVYSINQNCIKILDDRYSYIVGDGGTILKCTNTGYVLSKDDSGISSSLLSLCFSNANTGYAVGADGKILTTNLTDSITVRYCAADTLATLIAPALHYESYTWFDSENNIIGTSRIISVKNKGANRTYTCVIDMGRKSEISYTTSLTDFQVKADFDFEIANCDLNTLQFINKSQTANFLVKYKWDFGDGSILREKDPVYTFNSLGKRTVALEISSPLFGCPEIVSKDIEIFSPKNVKIHGDSLCCKGYTLTLRASGAPAYLWSNGSTADTLVVDENSGRVWVIGLFNGGICRSDTIFKTIKSVRYPIVISGYQTYCPGLATKLTASGAKTYFWSNGVALESNNISAPGGDYWVYGKSLGGCYSDTLYFTVSESPDWDLNLSGYLSFCKHDSTQIFVNGAVSNVWFNGTTDKSIYISQPGNYFVTGLNGQGCKKQLNFTVPESENPNSTFSVSTKQIDKKNNTLTVSVNPNLDNDYLWDMGDGTTFNGSTHQHSYTVNNSSFEYRVRLTATNKRGCMSYSEQVIDVVPFIPNVFTPNGDGINDIFVADLELHIFDRLGKTLYRGKDGWDGTYNGKEMPNDTYFYFIYYADKYGVFQTKKGSITLLR